MHRNRLRMVSWCVPLALVAIFVVPALASGQGGPGFLFRDPVVSLKLETGYGFQLANSDVYDFFHEELTISRKDFAAPYVGGELAARIGERWDLALGVGFSRSSRVSEYRLYEDNFGNPIEQTTALRTVPFTLSAKYYLAERGRSVGRFAWVPKTLTPYVGGGLGMVSYRFEQFGDFVDYDTLEIFYDQYVSSGQAALVRALAGIGVSLTAQMELTGEVRYQHASDELDSDFQGFDPLDLSGFQGVVGIALRF